MKAMTCLNEHHTPGCGESGPICEPSVDRTSERANGYTLWRGKHHVGTRRSAKILVAGGQSDLGPLLVDQQPDEDWLLQYAPSIQEAAVRLRRRKFDAVLLDLRSCAACDPSETVEQLRGIRGDAKVIAFASKSEASEVLEVIRAHAFGFFVEPWETSDVMDLLRRALEDPSWEDGIELISAQPEFIALRMRCRMVTAERIVHFMKAIGAGIPDQERADAAMAFRELLLNAIEHGGKMDPNEWVRVSRVRTRRALVYHVQDPGSGFTMGDLRHAAINNPPEDPFAHTVARRDAGLRSGGFGLLLASRLVDEVIYNECGNEVILIKHLEPSVP